MQQTQDKLIPVTGANGDVNYVDYRIALDCHKERPDEWILVEHKLHSFTDNDGKTRTVLVDAKEKQTESTTQKRGRTKVVEDADE